jgi:uncharacterized membrane protein YbhN (UPF0104 family)
MSDPAAAEPTEIRQALATRKLILPVMLGVGAAAWLLWSGLDDPVMDPGTGASTTTRALLKNFSWTPRASWALLGVLAFVVVRDVAYMIRLRVLSLGSFGWRQAFDSIMLWELASALTPSIIGGSAVAILILRREGMPVGRSVATVFVTAMMDELFYLTLVPLVFLVVTWQGAAFFPAVDGLALWGGAPIPVLFWSAYGLLAVLTSLIVLGVLVAPRWTRRQVQRVVGWRVLRRWAGAARRWADDMVMASDAMRGAGWRLWAKAMAATAASWLARFLTLNMILMIFLASVPHAAVLARQLVMWVVLMISPTPGSAGFAEVALPAFLGDVTGLGYLAIVAVVWRLATYFPYLFVGSVVLPGWLQKTRAPKNLGQ